MIDSFKAARRKKISYYYTVKLGGVQVEFVAPQDKRMETGF
jgi:hypothetical protein